MPSDAQEKKRLELEIAKLTGAITRHAAHANAYKPYPPRGRGGYRGGRGGAQRSMVLDTRQPVSSTSASASASASSSSAWVKNTSRTGNKSLMNPETFLKTEKARLARPIPVPKKRTKHQHGNVQMLSSDASATGPRRVVIDNVVFEFEEGGGKLVRIGDQAGSSKPAVSTPTRNRLSLSGHQYVRTKSGNLLSAETVRKRSDKGKSKDKASIPCRYFTKTGRCNRALTCPYTHDPTRLAICPKYLRNTCPYTALTCPVSHTATAHNAPSCVHFQTNGQCRNDPCVYPHVRVADDAPVCDAFAREGWCDKGEKCTERHAWECREWREKGTCARGTKCGLMHVLRAEKGRVLPAEDATTTTTTTEAATGDFDDGGEFIQFLDDQQETEVDDDQDEDGSTGGSDAVDSDQEDDDDDDDSDSDSGMDVHA